MHTPHLCAGWHAQILAHLPTLDPRLRKGVEFYTACVSAHSAQANRPPFLKILFTTNPDSIGPDHWYVEDPELGRVCAADVLEGLAALVGHHSKPDPRHAFAMVLPAPFCPPLATAVPITWAPNTVGATHPYGVLFIPLESPPD